MQKLFRDGFRARESESLVTARSSSWRIDEGSSAIYHVRDSGTRARFTAIFANERKTRCVTLNISREEHQADISWRAQRRQERRHPRTKCGRP